MSGSIDRRRVIVGTAVAAAGVPLLAACGDPSDGPGSGGSGTSSPQGTAGEALVAAADVPVGGGVVVGGAQVVVTQPVAGEFKAFSAVCTHQGCLVNQVRDGEIVCPCHFSKFSVEDGAVLDGDADAPLPEVGVAVQGDQVVRS